MRLQELLDRCKCGVYLTVNQHRDYYQTAAEAIDESGAPPDVVSKMIETNTIVELQFYPDTPIGYYQIWHYDVCLAVEEALACLDIY